MLHTPRIDLFCVERARRKRPHTACVQPGISVTRTLVILRGGHDTDRLSVHKRQHRYLPSGHKFFDNHPVARLTELLVRHDLADAVLRLR